MYSLCHKLSCNLEKRVASPVLTGEGEGRGGEGGAWILNDVRFLRKAARCFQHVFFFGVACKLL